MSLRQEWTWPEKAAEAQLLWSPGVDMKEEGEFKIPGPRAFRFVKRFVSYRSM